MMRGLLIPLFLFAALSQAQPTNGRQFVPEISKPNPERIAACASGCYMLTESELISALQNAGRVAVIRAKRTDGQVKDCQQ